MGKPKYIKKHIRERKVSHGRFTLQTSSVKDTFEILTFSGGKMIEEISYPSPQDPEERYSYVFIPEKITVEKAYSKTAKPAFTLRCEIEKENE